MRFSGVRRVHAPVAEVWTALHDAEVLGRVIPGCESLAPLGHGRYDAVLAARVGPVADVYRGGFAIEPLRAGRSLRVDVDGRGRFGRLQLLLDVDLDPDASGAGVTCLTYAAEATVRGVVARVGTPTMTVVGGHVTGCFFRDLDRAVRRPVGRRDPHPARGVPEPA